MVSDPMELDLQVVVAVLWVLVSEPRSPQRAVNTVNH